MNLYVALMRVLICGLPQLLPSHARCDTSLRREAYGNIIATQEPPCLEIPAALERLDFSSVSS